MKAHVRYVIGIFVIVLAGRSQTPAVPRAFEAAAIKLHPNCQGGSSMPPSGRLHMVCTNVRTMILAAYSEGPTPQRLPVLGGPAWIDSDTYDVDAKAENGNATPTEMYGPTLRALLEERLKVRTHKEIREVPIYALIVAKNGPKLQPTRPGSCTVLDMNHPPAAPAPGQTPPSFCGRIPIKKAGTKTILDAWGITLPRFAGRALLGSVDRPVFDKTGIEGMFDIHLEFSTDDSDLLSPSIYTAIQDQLGLKLTPDKGPMEVLVVDQVERPGEN